MSQTHSPKQMRESKSVATDRLRKEGRWNEASLNKDETIKRLRAEGKTKNEASEAAWDEMLAKFPPLPTKTTAQTKALDLAGADDELIDRLAAVPVDIERDTMWVYSALEHPFLRLSDAPSLAAWGMMRAARTDPCKFLASVLARTKRASKNQIDNPAPPDEPQLVTQDPGLADLERMIAARNAG